MHLLLCPRHRAPAYEEGVGGRGARQTERERERVRTV
jgi:hypothetical protein